MSTSRKSFERLLLLHQKFARASVHELAHASVLNNQVRAASNFGASTSSAVSRYSLKPSITSSSTTSTTTTSMTRSPMFNHVMFKLKRGAVMNTSSDAIRFGSSSSKRSFVTTALFPNLTRAMNETGFRKIVFAKRSPNTSTSSSGEQTTMAVVSRTMRTSLNNHSSSSSNSSVYRISVRAYAKSLSQMKESGLKAYKPTTPGFRGRVITDRSKLWKGKPLKQLTKGLMKSGGRNNHGRITVWHKGGGHKRLYREIDFKRDLYNVAGVVRRIEYDPNRTTRIALIDYPEGNKPRYILAPDGTKAGDVVMSGNAESTNTIDLRPGNAMSLSEMPIGTIIHNVELVPGKGGAMARSAGASATLVKKGSDGYCAIKLPSGELRLVPSKCVATVGVLSNREHQNINLGKAGAKRWKGVRPTVRGTAMNPIDHPHGGGEGRSKGDNKSVSPWGVETKGKRTRNNKRTDSMRLQRRPMNRKRYPLLVK